MSCEGLSQTAKVLELCIHGETRTFFIYSERLEMENEEAIMLRGERPILLDNDKILIKYAHCLYFLHSFRLNLKICEYRYEVCQLNILEMTVDNRARAI